MPRPRYRRRVDISKLNPFDPDDMPLIAAEWERLQARRARAALYGQRRRVALVIFTYSAIGAVLAAALFAVVAILRSL